MFLFHVAGPVAQLGDMPCTLGNLTKMFTWSASLRERYVRFPSCSAPTLHARVTTFSPKVMRGHPSRNPLMSTISQTLS